MRAVLYSRVSTDEQAESGYSLPEQRDRLRVYAEQSNLTIVAEVSDDFSGRSLARPGLEQLTSLAEQRAFDLLICPKLDRLARVNHLRRAYEEWLSERGIGVVYLDQQNWEPTPAGRLQRGILGEFAEYEVEVIRERTMGGKIRKARSGKFPVSFLLYGYKQVTKAEGDVVPQWLGRGGEIVVVEEEAAVVRRAFALYAGGQSLRGVLRVLNGEGLRTRSGSVWTPGVLRRLLQNEAYIGTAWYGRHQEQLTRERTPAGNPRRRQSPRPRAEWIGVPVPAIVDRPTFDVVQRQFAVNKDQLRGRPGREWLLKGLIYCSECRTQRGGWMACVGSDARAGKKRQSLRRYRCGSLFETGSRAPCGLTVGADRAEAAALDALARAADPDWLAAVARKGTEQVEREAGFPEAEIRRLEGVLAGLKQEERRLADLVLAGIGADVVAEKVADLARRRREAEALLAGARARAAVETAEEAETRAREWAAWLRERRVEAEDDVVAMRRLLKLFVEVKIRRKAPPVVTVQVPAGKPLCLNCT